MARVPSSRGSVGRGAAVGILVVSILAVSGCSALVAPSGIWFRVVGGQLEVSPCRDLDIDRIGLSASLVDGGNATASWEGETVSVAVGEIIRVPPPGWAGEGLDFPITDRSVWERITVSLAGPAGDHRSNLFGPSETWDYAATGGFFGLSEPDDCAPPAE